MLLPSGADRDIYQRHRPEETPLYRIVETCYPKFLARLQAEGESLPHFVQREFDDYLKCGLLLCGADSGHLDFEPGEAFDRLVGALIHYRIAIGPNAGSTALTSRTVPAQSEPFASTLLAKQPGFSLHAATCCEANQRDKLEKLCRYIARPAIASERLSTDDRGQVIYRFKQPFRDGSTHVVLDPLDCIARLAALVPRPRLTLTQFHGVFAPHCKHRESVVPKRKPRHEKPDKPLAPMTPMQRLKRVFAIDIETRPKCGGTLRVIACIENPDVIATILEHVGARKAAATAKPRAPPIDTEIPAARYQARLL